MKKVLIMGALLLGIAGYAQPGSDSDQGPHKGQREKMERPNYTPEQIAELKTKTMTLHLDLNESQQTEIYKINLDLAQKRKAKRDEGKDPKEMTDEERFQRQSAALDEQIAMKKRLKSVLTDEQFEKLERTTKKGHRNRGQRRQAGKRDGKRH